MGAFWAMVLFVGVIGTPADIALNQWSKTLSARWLLASAVLWAAFALGFGFTMRIGARHGYPLTVAVVLVLSVNTILVGVWDVLYERTSLTSLQWLGVALAVAAAVCFEFGKQQPP